VFFLALLSIAMAVIVWLPDDSLFTATFVWQDVVPLQVLLVFPSMEIIIVAIPLASEAVARTLKLPFVGITDPFTGAVMLTSGGMVSPGEGVAVPGGVWGGVTGNGVGVAVGFNIRLRFVPAN